MAVLLYIPVTLKSQRALGVPAPNATPRHLRAYPVEIAASYWVTWGISLIVLLAPAAVLAVFPRTRRIAVGYLITAAVIGGLLGALVIGVDIGGFAPD
ncbi:hypothetical protein [Nocardia sp. CS682]|uniref:hypothetical protein n=1 Tax=Nocardia sp. CS682 TaxID=1047172 RepID=UPI001F0DF944|nr:hypothetical protein [Nocardia sp. CS682]